MAHKIYIVIAAYNEGRAISKVLQDLKKHKYSKVVVVDDGSKDKTSEVAEKGGAIVIRHNINRGQGAALKTGIDYAIMSGANIIVTFDADGQHQAKEIKRLVEPVAQGEVDVVLGSRFLRGGKDVPLSRKILLKGSVIVQDLFYGVKLTDAHNGFRAFSRKAAMKINLTADRMAHASQIINEISKKNISYKEVPVTILYTEYSKQHGAASFTQALRVLWRMILDKIHR